MRTTAGVTIYAVEAAVWAALTAAWVSLRFAMTPSLADQSLMVAAPLLSVFHLLLSSALGDSPATEEAYFNAVLPLWITYAALVGDAAVSPARLDNALFGGLTLFLIPAAISLAFLTVQALLAAAAASRDGTPLWKPEAMWLDGTILLLTASQACLFHERQLGVASTALSLDALLIVTLGGRLWGLEAKTARIFEIAHLCLIGLICILTVVGAYVSGTTVWALVLVLAPLVALSIVRFVAWTPNEARKADQAHQQQPPPPDDQPSAPPASLVFAQPTGQSAAMTFAQPSGAPRLLAPPPTSSRPVVKKQL
jgi:hypothetical protein